MKRVGLSLGLVALSCAASAQIPDVRFKFDLRVSYRVEQEGPSSVRLYDSLGRPSVFALTFALEPGLKAFASQRLEQLPGTGDKDSFDEFYVEDEGIWRLGKQYLPFGSGTVLRETAMAVRGDSSLLLNGIPVSFAFCDAGPERNSGGVLRLGHSLSASVAFGKHFGIQPTSLVQVRLPGQAPGAGRGYRKVYGAQIEQKIAKGFLRAEFVGLRSGHTEFDPDRDIIDVTFRESRNLREYVLVGWTRDSDPRHILLRLEGAAILTRDATFEPMLRVRDGKLFDLSLGVRFRY